MGGADGRTSAHNDDLSRDIVHNTTPLVGLGWHVERICDVIELFI